ncbi:MAG: (d)CMP kinase [Peptostreptococcaceae bacterium]|nr:(d)CMP kinase [Peptostreptococcaceae bacterium]MDY5738808.1 (d)CMP kinase [Anaerovoracaceae bacterium]
MQEIFQIAIDGPGGAGKSTIAKEVAARLGIDYIDTGAMYRAVACKLIRMDALDAEESYIEKILNDTKVDFSSGKTILDGIDVSEDIRKAEISAAASKCSALRVVREKLVSLQQAMGQRKSVVMDGRDIGTNVFTNAKYKFYLTADPKVRAKRRYDELTAKGQQVEFEQVLKDIISRDEHDMNRKLNPLKKAADAIEIDSSNMSIEAVVEFICKEI